MDETFSGKLQNTPEKSKCMDKKETPWKLPEI